MHHKESITRLVLDKVSQEDREEVRSLLASLLSSATSSDQASVDQDQDAATWLPAPEVSLERTTEEPQKADTPDGWQQEIRDDIFVIARSIMDVKEQILDLQAPDASSTKFREANNELDEVVRSTEEATHQILNAAEVITKALNPLKVGSCAGIHQQEIEAIEAECLNIMTASSFQDITSQRIKKVVAALYFIEYKITEMLGNLGVTSDSPRLPERSISEEITDDQDRHLMQGPAAPGSKSISQDSIDSLFD